MEVNKKELISDEVGGLIWIATSTSASSRKKRTALDHEIDKTLSEIQKILGIDINIKE